ncbi:MAG: MlaD family protein [Pseudomonadota bacterium]
MEPRANYALIGAFVLAAAIGVLGFILWLGQSEFRASFDEYDVVFKGPVTLDEGAQVRYIGIVVGDVRWVRIDRSDPSKVRARIRVDSETPVKTDSSAGIDFAGITGVTFVQINAGSADAGRLQRRAGDPVPVIRSDRSALEQLVTSGQEVLGRSNTAAQQINKLLTDENIEHVARTLENLDTITTKLAEEDGAIEDLEAALETLRAAGETFDAASGALGDVGRGISAEIDKLVPRIEALMATGQSALDRMSDAAGEGLRALTSAADTIEGPTNDTVVETGLAARDLRRLIARIDEIAREIESDPQSVVLGDPQPYEDRR